jgi:hypothetical protein
MNPKKSRVALKTAIDNVADSKPVVNILNYDLAGEGLARVLCSVSHTGNSRTDHSLIAASIRASLAGKMEPVAGSFTSLSAGNYQEQITGVVSVVREAISADAKTVADKGFKSISANMFMDDEEHMWVLRKSSAGDLLVKTTGIDDDLSLIKLLDHACSGSSTSSSVSDYRQMVAHASSVYNSVQGGDFVSYVNINNEVVCGYVVATVSDTPETEADKALVLPVGGDEEELINTKAITEVHSQDTFPEMEITEEEAVDSAVSASRGDVSVASLLDYYKKVFARSPKFYQEFARRLKAHAFC